MQAEVKERETEAD